jgi:hypothetical protein
MYPASGSQLNQPLAFDIIQYSVTPLLHDFVLPLKSKTANRLIDEPIGGGKSPSLIAAPVTHHTCGAGVEYCASAEIQFELEGVGSVNISIAEEVPVTG